MSNNKTLTGIVENGVGFAGKRNLKFSHTKNGKSKMTFDLACGKGDEINHKFPTWRHCVAYGRLADAMRGLVPGQMVKFSGWVSTEARLDEYFKLLRDKDNELILDETLILKTADILEHTKLQPELELAAS